MIKIPFHHVDAFTAERFRGNPAVVCLLAEPIAENLMQAIAAEMNVSETAFVHRLDGTRYRLRWFTPVTEVDLCGHATLATAHILWEQALLAPREPARFETASGLLCAVLDADTNWIELDFPRRDASAVESPPGVREALGLSDVISVRRNREKVMYEVPSEAHVRALRPDFGRLRETGIDIIVTAATGSVAQKGKPDFVSRYFAVHHGINEDPVTGSAHCVLGPYWSEKLGKKELLAYQASARGGYLKLRVTDERVKLSGQAVTVSRGELEV